MRHFDWLPFLKEHRIDYVERGPNVKSGEISIRCPWCGSADPSHHLGIAVNTTGWYSCWRNRSAHSGKSPIRLIMRLLNVSYGKARELTGLRDDYVDPEGFTAMAARLLRENPESAIEAKPTRDLMLDPHFTPIVDDRVTTRRWWNYLYQRGFDRDDIAPLCQRYELMAARGGEFDSRLIIPYIINNTLVSWTGRAIADAKIRYKDLEKERSLIHIKNMVYNHDAMYLPWRGFPFQNGRALAIVEGPIDALKIDYYGCPYGVRAVSLSTNSISEDQAYMIESGAENFEHVYLMADNKTGFGSVDTMRLMQDLSSIRNLRGISPPAGRGDAGEAKPQEIRDWASHLTGVQH